MKGEGGQNERTICLRFASQMTISSYQRKIKTLYHFFFYLSFLLDQTGFDLWLGPLAVHQKKNNNHFHP